MRHIGYLLFTALLLCAVVLSAVSCALDREDATELMEDFFEAIEERNYEKAERLLHPDYPHDLAADFAKLEERFGIPLNSAFDIDEDTPAKRVSYSEVTDIPGATYMRTYELPFDAGLHGNKIEISATVLKNDNGYGICNFTIDLIID